MRLLRLAHEPWDVLRRHVWPRSFREHIAAVTDVTRDRGGEVICFTILAFCGRDWWAGHGAIEGEARVPGPIGAALAGDASGAEPAHLRRVPAVPNGAGEGAEAVLRVPRGVLLHAEGDGRQGGVPAQGVERAQEGVQEGDEGAEAARGGGGGELVNCLAYDLAVDCGKSEPIRRRVCELSGL